MPRVNRPSQSQGSTQAPRVRTNPARVLQRENSPKAPRIAPTRIRTGARTESEAASSLAAPIAAASATHTEQRPRTTRHEGEAPSKAAIKLRRRRIIVAALAALLVILIAWPVGLLMWTNSKITHVDALSSAKDTPGETYLLAGADLADGGKQRTDTLMLLHKATNGKEYLVSIPRDTLVDIPGHGKYKINAAYSIGGAPLLVQTMEHFTGLKIDHFMVIGFGGVQDVVDAIGTVNLCIDQNVDDVRSGLKMTKGCHDVGGEQALAFVRARYFDPTADLGRQKRQQQFVSSLMKRIATPDILLNPFTHAKIASAGSKSIVTDKGTGIWGISQAVLIMRGASGSGGVLQMPIEDENFQTKHSGVAIKVNDQQINTFFRSIENGTATQSAAK